MLFDDTPEYTVSELNAEVREALADGFSDVRVVGELSNVRPYPSGHVYFTLKDAEAQIGAVCFRSDARRLTFDLEDGMRVVARGGVTIYDKQGKYQLVVRSIELAGRGDLERAFNALKEKLEAEGLFAAEHKQALPAFPFRIGVITSASGAAVRDIIATVRRRWPPAELLVYPVRVQGEGAAMEIAHALQRMPAVPDLDLVIVGRGGGSLEDLWAFNEEAVARAIYACPVPVVSAVGHETDFTIADFVADVRAATPTMAAELVVPDVSIVSEDVESCVVRLGQTVRRRLDFERHRVDRLLESYALGRIKGRIEGYMQQQDHLLDRLQRSMALVIRDRRHVLERLNSRVGPRLRERVGSHAGELNERMSRLRPAMRDVITSRSTRLREMTAKLEALDVRSVLERGFSLCSDPSSGRLIKNVAAAIEAGAMRVAFRDGSVETEVKEQVHEQG